MRNVVTDVFAKSVVTIGCV